jgi:hypothetical protein
MRERTTQQDRMLQPNGERDETADQTICVDRARLTLAIIEEVRDAFGVG